MVDHILEFHYLPKTVSRSCVGQQTEDVSAKQLFLIYMIISVLPITSFLSHLQVPAIASHTLLTQTSQRL